MIIRRSRNRHRTGTDWFVVIELLMCALIIWNTFAEQWTRVSLVFAASFLILLGAFIMKLPRKGDELFVLTVLIVVISFLSVLFSWQRNREALTFETLKSYFIFCATILYMYMMAKIEINRDTAYRILGVGVVISALYPAGYLYFGFSNSKYGYFTMNFSNPNLTGIFLLQAVLFAILGTVLAKKRIIKGICVGLAAIDLLFLYWTEARNDLISFTLIALMAVGIFLKQQNKLPKWVLFFLTIYPLVFMILYLKLVNMAVVQESFDFMVEDGKPLTSRVLVWSLRLYGLKGHYLTGDYFNLGGNAHNSHLVILVSFGVIVLALVVWYLYRILEKIDHVCESPKQVLCLLAFCGTLFTGMGEGALFSGGVGLYIVGCTPLLLARFNWDYLDTKEDL